MSDTTDNRSADPASLDDSLDRLCAHLDIELARQRDVLEACRSQDAAARSQDVDLLEAATQRLVALMREALDAEKERVALLRKVVGPLGLEPDRQTLTGLIASTGEPWRSRLQAFQKEFREVLGSTQTEVRSHSGYLRRAGRIVERSLHAVTGTVSVGSNAYDKEGREPLPGHRGPALVNTLG